MHTYLTDYLVRNPEIAKIIVSRVITIFKSAPNTEFEAVNDMIKAVYNDAEVDSESAYKALLRIIKNKVDGAILPHPSYIRNEVQGKANANRPEQNIYHALEDALGKKVILSSEESAQITQAINSTVNAFLAYKRSYGGGDHAKKINEVSDFISMIAGSDSLPAVIKLAEIQRVFATEINHKLKPKEVDEYRKTLPKDDEPVAYLGSKEFIKLKSTFSKVIIFLQDFCIKVITDLQVDTKLEEALETHPTEGLAVLSQHLEEYGSLYEKEFVRNAVLAIMRALVEEPTPESQIEAYNAIRSLMKMYPEHYQSATVKLLMEEERVVKALLRFIFANEDAEKVVTKYKDISLDEATLSAIIKAHLDQPTEESEPYLADKVITLIVRMLDKMGEAAKDLHKRAVEIQHSPNLSVLEQIEGLRDFLAKAVDPRQVKDPRNKLEGFTFRVLSIQDSQENVLLNAELSGGEKQQRAFIAAALAKILLSYQDKVLYKVGKATHVPNLKEQVEVTRGRSRSTYVSFPSLSLSPGQVPAVRFSTIAQNPSETETAQGTVETSSPIASSKASRSAASSTGSSPSHQRDSVGSAASSRHSPTMFGNSVVVPILGIPSSFEHALEHEEVKREQISPKKNP